MIGRQLLAFKRRISRAEVAKRIANYNPKMLKKVYSGYLQDPNLTYAAYGPTDFVMRVYDEMQHEWAKMKDIPF